VAVGVVGVAVDAGVVLTLAQDLARVVELVVAVTAVATAGEQGTFKKLNASTSQTGRAV